MEVNIIFRIIIDDLDNYEYKLRVVTRPSIPVTNYEYNETKITNRGSLYSKVNIPDKELEVEFSFVEKVSFGQMLRRINAWFLNAKKIRFSDDMDVYYKVKCVNIENIERQLKILGTFTVTFTIDPHAYSIEGDTPITIFQHDIAFAGAQLILNNFGTKESLPKIRLYGNGTLTLTINGKLITLNSVVGYIDVDGEMFRCNKDATNMNKNMVGDFPVFNVGENTIVFSPNVSQIDIVPRWRYL